MAATLKPDSNGRAPGFLNNSTTEQWPTRFSSSPELEACRATRSNCTMKRSASLEVSVVS